MSAQLIDELCNQGSAPAGDINMHSPSAESSASSTDRHGHGSIASPMSVQVGSPVPESIQDISFKSLLPSKKNIQTTQPAQSQLSAVGGLIYHPYLSTLHLAVNKEFLCLVCTSCKITIPRTNMTNHIATNHSIMNVDQIQLNGALSETNVASVLPTEIRGPRDIVQGLAVWDAFSCDHCPKIYTTEQKIQDHHQREHKNITAPRAWRMCRAQSMNAQGYGTHHILWEVKEPAVADAKDISTGALANSLLKELEQDFCIPPQANQDFCIPPQANQDERMITPWLMTTRWHEYLATAPHEVETLRNLVAIPKDNDETLPGLRLAVTQYFKHALDLLDTSNELVLQRLNSPDPVKEGISNTPLHRHMLAKTMDGYVIPVAALLAFLLCKVPRSEELANALQTLLEGLQGRANQDVICKCIHAVLISTWTITWKRITPGTIADPTEECLALLTLQRGGTFKEPKDITNTIAKFTYCMRLTFLMEIQNCAASTDPEVQHKACDSLQPWFTEKTLSTFARLRSLQHRASAISYDTMGLPKIWWKDTENWTSMLYKGEEIQFRDLCSMFADTEARLVELWEQCILNGTAQLIDELCIVDDLTNREVGYSFVADPRNTAFKCKGQLVQAALAGEGGFAHYATVLADGKVQWNKRALRTWLQDYAEMGALLLLRAEMLSGAPGRGTELTAMTYRNTKTRPTRNLVMLGNHLTILCQYMKMTALTGRDKMIPHALDGLTSNIMIQDLALACPFAEIAAKVCFPDKPEIRQLYHDHLFVNFDRLFTSEDLSNIMSKYSLPCLKFALTINPWRHIQTAWKRKFQCLAEDIMEEDMVDNVEATSGRAHEVRLG
ncbi:hypothetical protein BKA82DRAFT_4364894 [Pisolithus tinctorius]|nr:hypothetical protein BKA82DRAFT_4364894 [Pisolithus tinctorius]